MMTPVHPTSRRFHLAALTFIVALLLLPSGALAAPIIRFLSYDPNDVGVLRAKVTDQAVIRSGEISIRRVGDVGFVTLPTRVEDGQLVGRFNADTFPVGRYEALGVATNSNGEQRASSLGENGSPFYFDLVTRVATSTSLTGDAKPGSVVTATVSDAAPTSGVTVYLDQRVQGQKVFKVVGQAVTGADGRAAFTLDKNIPSGPLRVRFAGDAARMGSTSGEVVLSAPVRLTMRVSRSTARIGQSVRFTGKVLSQPVPSKGAQVKLQAYDRGRWITFKTIRTDKKTGSYSYTYRFKRSRGTVTYPFRATVLTQSGLPFATNSSPTRQVKVIGR